MPWGSAIRQAAACAAGVLCALPATRGYYGYVASADGRGHWIHVLPVEGGVRTPRGELERRGAILPLMLDLRCRDGEVPVQARLSWPKHPLDPPAVRLVQRPLGWLWRVAAGAGVYRERLRVVLGQAAFEGVVGRRREALREETDYQLALPARETVRQLRAAAGGPLRVELEGPRTSGGATYRIAPAFARWAAGGGEGRVRRSGTPPLLRRGYGGGKPPLWAEGPEGDSRWCPRRLRLVLAASCARVRFR